MTLYPLGALALLLVLLGSGCAPNRLTALFPPPPDQQLFSAGLEELSQSSTPKAFQQLRREFPASPWTERAELVNRLISQRDRQASQVSRQRQELTRLKQQLERLEQDKELLQGDLTKLKQLLIDNELRTR